MEGQHIILIHWKGCIEEGTEGAKYCGGTSSLITIEGSLSMMEFIEKLYEMTRYPKDSNSFRILGRFQSQSSPRYFVCIPVDSIEVFHTLVRSAERHGNCTEFFIEAATIMPSTSVVAHQNADASDLCSPVINSQNAQFFAGLGEVRSIVAGERSMRDADNIIRTTVDETNNEIREYFDELAFMGVDHAASNEQGSEFDFCNETHFELAVNTQVSSQLPITECQFYKGLEFATKEQLEYQVITYNLKYNYSHKVNRSSKSRWEVECKIEGCCWLLRARKLKGSERFHITHHCGPHRCVNPTLNTDHFNMSSEFIGKEIEELVRADFTISVPTIRAHIGIRFSLAISYNKAWLGKRNAITKLFGDWIESYKILPQWMDEVVKANLGTAVVWWKEPGPFPGKDIFLGVFWAFGPSIGAFKHCRPVISVDGTHLYGKYKATLLIAIATDADDMVLPVAFAVVDRESIQSWTWFMACFREKVCPNRKLCVVSDRHIGIRTAMQSDGLKEPAAVHRYCLRHMASNFQSKFGNVHLKKAIHIAATQNQICKFNGRMDAVEFVNPDARTWWENVPLDRWALCHDGGKRFGITTTNLSESFNNVLTGARCLPITALVQLTFYRLFKYFNCRRQSCERMLEQGQKWSNMANKKFKRYSDSARRHEVVTFDHVQGLFEVRTGHRALPHGVKGGNTHVVNLRLKKCTCQKLQLYGIPCSHVLAACASRNLDFSPYVKSWYEVAALSLTYSYKFNPVLDKRYWRKRVGDELIPDPATRRQKPGRPVSTRLRNEMDCREPGQRNRCSGCQGLGHKITTCPKKKIGTQQSSGGDV